MDLTGKVLIAMPGMGDPRFVGSVVILCAYSNDGAMGLIVNKPVHEMSMRDLFEQLEITQDGDANRAPLFFGGPVETGRGFVLHTDEYHSGLSSLRIGAGFSMTATQDILEDIAADRGPRAALVALGYSGWGPGQLEAEIAENGWLIGDASESLVFETAPEDIWARALKALGVDPLTLSATAGHA
ncbi:MULTISPECIES: YqgE/AlgH family protein [Shimia]|uniref:YqgE/AlgH family protein n=1 Tax=Shimia TaxID=573139 RepID=UPI001FB20D96|nr:MULTISPECIES: YqgE/AlgH family protein [Shimia]MDV4145017.1 YqgE/AlgH family protein [Shimia sp. FJ5]